MIHNLKSSFLTHGLDFTYQLSDKAFLQKLRSQSGIKSNGHYIVAF